MLKHRSLCEHVKPTFVAKKTLFCEIATQPTRSDDFYLTCVKPKLYSCTGRKLRLVYKLSKLIVSSHKVKQRLFCHIISWNDKHIIN